MSCDDIKQQTQNLLPRIQLYLLTKYKTEYNRILSYCSYNQDYFQMVKKQDQEIITLYYKLKIFQPIKKKILIDKEQQQLKQYAQQYEEWQQNAEINTFFQQKDTVLYIEKQNKLEKLFIQFNPQIKCTTANLQRINKLFQLKGDKTRLESYNDLVKYIQQECKKMSIKFEQKNIQILDMIHLETSPQESEQCFNFVNQDTVLQIFLLNTKEWRDFLIFPTSITLYKVDDIKKIVFKCVTAIQKVESGQFVYKSNKLMVDQTFATQIFNLIYKLPIKPENILFRTELLKNINILSLVYVPKSTKQKIQGQQQDIQDLKILVVPPIQNASNYYISEFVYKHLLLNYQKQFTITNLIYQFVMYQLYYFSNKARSDDINKRQWIFKAIDSGSQVYQQINELYDKYTEQYKLLIQLTQSPSITLIRFVKTYGYETKSTLLTTSLLKLGFLDLRSQLFECFLTFEQTYYNFMHFDTLTTFEGLQEHLIVLQEDQQPIQQIYRLIPKIYAFTEIEPISLTMKIIPQYQILGDVEDYINEKTAIRYLVYICHEIQNLPLRTYKCDLETDIEYLPQLLSDITSLNPFATNITFQIQKELGVDQGGIWRYIMTLLFDNLIDQVKITTDILKEMKSRKKIVRDIDFDKINAKMCGDGKLFKVIETRDKSLLCPIYSFYEYKLSTIVYPRITDKRSAIYYLGRILAYCLIYNAKIPDYFQENFYKVLVGGRFYFDFELKKQYAQQIEENKMFTINGTKDIYELQDLQFTDEEVNNYYKDEIYILKSMQEPDWDRDFSGLNDNTIEMIQMLYRFNIEEDYQQRKRYSENQLKNIKNGRVFHKFYTELRLGFRHALVIFQSDKTIQTPYVERLQKLMDLTLDKLQYEELKQFITYKEYDEEQIKEKEQIVNDLFARNYQKLDYQNKFYNKQEAILNNIIKCLSQMTYEDITTFIFAVTGSRSIINTSVEIKFIEENSQQKRFIEFHTCFNEFIVPLEYVYSLNFNDLQKYIMESTNLALKNGFGMA